MPIEPDLIWMSSNDVLAKYEKWNGGRSILKENLAEQIRDAQVRTRGVLIGKVEANSAKEAWKKTEKVGDVYDLVEIDRGKWRQSRLWAADQKEWRWTAGNFSISVRLKPRRRIMIRKLELCETDLQKILLRPAPTKKGGRPPSVREWKDFYFSVIELAQKGLLNPNNIPDTPALLDQVSQGMEGDGFSHRIMKASIEAVFQRFIEEDKVISEISGDRR